MEIHELNTSTLTAPAFMALDNGVDSYKLDFNALYTPLNARLTAAEETISELGGSPVICYGVCASPAANSGKVITSDDFTGDGNDYIVIKFTNGNTASQFQMNIAGMGLMYTKFNGSNSAPMLDAGSVLLFRIVDTQNPNNFDEREYHFVGYYPKSKFEEIDEELDDLNNAINLFAENGNLYVDKTVTWINAWVNGAGLIANSSASKTGLVTLNKGETVKIGTRNTNITIIGYTTASTIAVGDTVTPLRKTTSSATYQEYSYTAEGQINIVLCVRASEYNLVFYKNSTFLDNITDRLNRDLTDIVPVVRNGSVTNSANAHSVSNNTVVKIPQGIEKIDVFVTRDLPDGYHLYWQIIGFAEGGAGLLSVDAVQQGYYVDGVNTNKEVQAEDNLRFIEITQYLNSHDQCFCVAVWAFNADGSRIVLRESTDQYCLRIKFDYFFETDEKDAPIIIKNARHVDTGNNPPLTLLHFSDLHNDTSALARILAKSGAYNVKIDDKICTGDMVADTYAQIASWWCPDVLTCIGNHDTASYSGGSYNWTALSMADRDAYYITPFKSLWGITHTSGKSYYYKDYASQKIRLVVMDGMLYTNAGAEATAQTSWLEGLLASAITNNLHVLIAIHAPHGGASPVDCSFTEYGTGTMPTYSDCNTPQAVVDAVATKITAGLKFIGYLVGHTHRDVIWDAENNGKQLMYCVTCAAVAQTAQWQNADMYRGTDADAFNIVTIDTSNTLIKIVRGGGADIDDHMRTRKAICFNYSTGEKVGEVL